MKINSYVANPNEYIYIYVYILYIYIYTSGTAKKLADF